MESAIFEEILYGELNPRGQERNLRLAVSDAIPDEKTGFYRYMNELILSWPGSGTPDVYPDSPEPGWETLLTPEKHFITPEREPPFDRLSSFYEKVVTAEGCWLLTEVVYLQEHTPSEDDLIYRLTLALRKWGDYLRDAARQINRQESGDELRRYVLRALQMQLMALICDLSVRFENLPLPETYTPETIYPGLLDMPVPEQPALSRTPAWFGHSANKLILAKDSGERLTRMAERLVKRIEAEPAGSRRHEYLQILHHLENAFFLILFKAAYINRDKQKLANADYTREWMIKTRKQCITGKNYEELHENLNRAWETAARMRTLFPRQGHHNGEASEARMFMYEVESAEEKLLAATGTASLPVGGGSGKTPRFVQHIQDHFTTKEELKIAFNINSPKTLKDFLDKARPRYVEITPNIVLYYRGDIEKYMNENSKTERKGKA